MIPFGLRLGTIRFRITAIATVAVAVVLAFVAVALVAVVRRELYTNLDDSLEQRADTYETSLREEDDISVLLNSNDEDRAAQVVDSSGVVIASTANLAGSPPLDDRARTTRETSIRSETIATLDDDAYRVLSRDVELESGRAVLHVAQNVDDLSDTVRNLTIVLLVALPLVIATLAALVWWLVGRTLRPVELIRQQVDDISGTDLERRLPVPEQADEIARLAATMNRMLDRIDQAGRRQRQFVADASHELRTPLTRIRTELEVDRNRPELADTAMTHAAVLEETLAVQELLEDLLFLARSDENQHVTRRRPVDLDDIVFREAGRHRATSSIRVDTSGVSAAHLHGDGGQLARAVRNLLSNALRHAETAVNLTLTQNERSIRLTVTDDGPGVPSEMRGRIFERFGRADDARSRSHGGTGLGLAIVRDIVTRHGGQIRYDETWTDGARFVIEFDGPSAVP